MPRARLERAVGERRRREQGHARCRADAEPDDGAAQVRVVAAGHEEEHDLAHADDGIGAREQAGRVVEDVGDAEGGHESAAIAAMIASRTTPSSGSTTLVSQAYPTHAHQRTPSTSTPWARPSQVGLSAMSAVHWVSARTKTRSKKSSSGITRSPSSRPRAALGCWACRDPRRGTVGVRPIASSSHAGAVTARRMYVGAAGGDGRRAACCPTARPTSSGPTTASSSSPGPTPARCAATCGPGL